MQQPVEINALIHVLNDAVDDPETLIVLAAELVKYPWLQQQWRFSIRNNRLCADRRVTLPTAGELETAVEHLLTLATTDEAKRQAVRERFSRVPTLAHLGPVTVAQVTEQVTEP